MPTSRDMLSRFEAVEKKHTVVILSPFSYIKSIQINSKLMKIIKKHNTLNSRYIESEGTKEFYSL